MTIHTNTRTPGRFAEALDSKIVFPEDPRWDETRRAWNLAADQQPTAIALPESVEDVIAAVELATALSLRIAAQSTGHNATPLGDLSGTLLVKTEGMRSIEVNPATRIARIAAGVQSLELVEAAAAHGLAPIAGSSPDVGMVGYTLGGGLGWLGRRYGLASSSVRAIELVTADGRRVRADHENHPDLFWALRGGGGDFGIVTALELELVPITTVYAGVLWWPIERDHEVLHAWADLTRSELPDEFTTVGRYLRFPPIPDIPEPLRGQSFVVVQVVHAGDPAQADELLKPLRALRPVNDTIRSMSTTELTRMHMDPEHPVPASGGGLLLQSLPTEAVDQLISTAGAGAHSPLLSVEVRHLGGELGRARPENGALAALDSEYALFAVGIAPTGEAKLQITEHLGTMAGGLRPWTSDRSYLNFTEQQRDPRTFWTPAAYTRLSRVKASIDPGNLIRSNHPIHQVTPPAGVVNR
jgi:FAD binding domain/Berberine and berberine like